MWLFNSGRPWGLPQNVFYVKDATIQNIDYDDPNFIRGAVNCVGADEQRRRGDDARLLDGRRLHGAELHHPAE